MIIRMGCLQLLKLIKRESKIYEPNEIHIPPNPYLQYHNISLSGDFNLPDCPFKRLQFFLINHVSFIQRDMVIDWCC